MRVLFALTAPFIPEATGGIESSIHDSCSLLRARGMASAVLARFRKHGYRGGRHAVRRALGLDGRLVRDENNGYPVFRTSEPLAVLDLAVSTIRPDVVIVQRGKIRHLAEALCALDVPVLVYLHNAEFDAMSDGYPSDNRILYIANSTFTANAFRQAFGLPALVLPPLVDPARYRTESRRETVTFVNPIPIKGLDIAISLAETRPDIPFLFVESWPLTTRQRRGLSQRIKHCRNVTLVERTQDMRSIYARTRLLLVPSIWNEAWGRVVTEAQICGIPVLASDVGGLPEAVGNGGLVVNPTAPLSDWADELGRLWDDLACYAEYCRRASDRVQLYDVDHRYVADRFIQIVESHAR